MTGFTLAVNKLLLGVLLLSVIAVSKLSLISSHLSPKTVNLYVKKKQLRTRNWVHSGSNPAQVESNGRTPVLSSPLADSLSAFS